MLIKQYVILKNVFDNINNKAKWKHFPRLSDTWMICKVLGIF